MTKWYYHATTMERAKQIEKCGYIKPASGKTYKDKIFLSDNEKDARLIAFMKHATYQGEVIAVFKIHRNALRRKLIGKGDKHTSINVWGDCYTYPELIDINHPQVFVGAAPYTLNLPEGVNLIRDGSSTGLSFDNDEIAREYGL
jgi:hypothetical protein